MDISIYNKTPKFVKANVQYFDLNAQYFVHYDITLNVMLFKHLILQ